jgi:hypothetical protein
MKGNEHGLASHILLARGENSLVEGFAAKETQWLVEREQLMEEIQSARWPTSCALGPACQTRIVECWSSGFRISRSVFSWHPLL